VALGRGDVIRSGAGFIGTTCRKDLARCAAICFSQGVTAHARCRKGRRRARPGCTKPRLSDTFSRNCSRSRGGTPETNTLVIGAIIRPPHLPCQAGVFTIFCDAFERFSSSSRYRLIFRMASWNPGICTFLVQVHLLGSLAARMTRAVTILS
jgi:hypothetical protein